MTRFALTLVFLTAFPVVSRAGPDVFDCKVLSLSELSKKGTFETGTKYQKEQIGSTFSVDRKSGKIEGYHFINNRGDESIEVINNDPSVAGFYVISKSRGPGRMVSYLFINAYKDESHHPFIYTLSGQYVYTGICQ